MSDFALASGCSTYSAFLRKACNTPVQEKTSADFFFLTHCRASPHTQLLDQVIKLLSQRLHERAAYMTNKDISRLMRCIADLDERREEAELAANPARRAGIKRLGEQLAYKA